MFGDCLASVFPLLSFSVGVAGGAKKYGELLAVDGEEKKKKKKMGSDLILPLQELDRTAAIDGGVALLLFGQ